MTTASLRLPPSGPPAMYNGVPVEIGSGFATRSDRKWSNGPIISVPANTGMVLYGASPAEPLLPEILDPSPALSYEVDFSFFYEHSGAASLEMHIEISLDGGAWVVPSPPGNGTLLHLTGNTMVNHSTTRFLGSVLGVSESTQSLRARLVFSSDNTAAYDVGYVRWGSLTEFLV